MTVSTTRWCTLTLSLAEGSRNPPQASRAGNHFTTAEHPQEGKKPQKTGNEEEGDDKTDHGKRVSGWVKK